MPSSRSAQVHRRHVVAKSRVSNGADVLPGVDGRSMVARRFRDISEQICIDQGGLDSGLISESRLQLIRRFAAASCIAELLEAKLVNGENIDISEHALLCSSLCRLSSRIGIDRRARNITPLLKDYLDDNATEDAT